MAIVEKHTHDHNDASCDEGGVFLEIDRQQFEAAKNEPEQQRIAEEATDLYLAMKAKQQDRRPRRSLRAVKTA